MVEERLRAGLERTGPLDEWSVRSLLALSYQDRVDGPLQEAVWENETESSNSTV